MKYESPPATQDFLDPSALILSSNVFSNFSYAEKNKFLENLSAGIASSPLINFCVSNLTGARDLIEYHDLSHHLESESTCYSLKPFASMVDLLSDLKAKISDFRTNAEGSVSKSVEVFLRDFTPVQQILFFDFYLSTLPLQTSNTRYRGNVDKKISGDLVLNLMIGISDSTDSCVLSDACYTFFFSRIYINSNDRLKFSARQIHYLKMNASDNYIDQMGHDTLYSEAEEDLPSLNRLLSLLDEDGLNSRIPYYHILGNAIFPPTKNPVATYGSLTKGYTNGYLSAVFLDNEQNFAASALVHLVLDSCTVDSHKKWLDYLFSYYPSKDLSDICLLLSKDYTIYETGLYYTKNLMAHTDANSLLRLSAIQASSQIPPALKEVIQFHLRAHRDQVENISLFSTQIDATKYEQVKDYWLKLKENDGFRSDLQHGFGFLRPDALAQDLSQSLLKFLVLCDGSAKLISEAGYTAKSAQEYIAKHGLDSEHVFSRSDFTKFYKEYPMVDPSLGNETLDSLISQLSFPPAQFDYLKAFNHLVNRRDQKVLDSLIQYSDLYETDLANEFQIQFDTEKLELASFRAEVLSKIDDENDFLRRELKENKVPFLELTEAINDAVPKVFDELSRLENRIPMSASPFLHLIMVVLLITILVLVL
jgi:hypothetical protein